MESASRRRADIGATFEISRFVPLAAVSNRTLSALEVTILITHSNLVWYFEQPITRSPENPASIKATAAIGVRFASLVDSCDFADLEGVGEVCFDRIAKADNDDRDYACARVSH